MHHKLVAWSAVFILVTSPLSQIGTFLDMSQLQLQQCLLNFEPPRIDAACCSTANNSLLLFALQVDQAPELLRPADCLGSIPRKEYPDITDWEPKCEAARQRAAAGSCSSTADKITREKPLLKCSYRSLSNFYQMQQHIRNHGAIVSRMIVNDDWEVQFNESARNVSGLQWPAYTRNVSAKAVFGHAVALVGYDNENYQWIGINSWGNDTNSNERTRGVTSDGLFRIEMGLAGVGTPEQTYGVSCTVFPGNQKDLHGTGWLTKQRRQVQPLNAASALNVTADCYSYRVQRKETVASIVESLGLDYVDFIQRNRRQFGRLQNVSYKLAQTKTAVELQKILTVVSTVTQPLTADKPYFVCAFYDAKAVASNVTCFAEATDACARTGTVGCTLHYKDVNVREELPAGVCLALHMLHCRRLAARSLFLQSPFCPTAAAEFIISRAGAAAASGCAT
eukprot:GHRQ01027646.1.p1 GENE.GHRQ01027646.1~~GHRQ01027646.1.p1  ORF type:complete len:451 (+),score=70.12 GHRQ01027646.1:210-1562(+)